MSSQLWTCHLFLLYGIFKSIEKVFYPVFFFFTLSFLLVLFFWTLAHRQIIQAFSDLEKRGSKERERHSHGVPFCQNHGMGEEDGAGTG